MEIAMQERYLSGLLKMRSKGIRILFNGKELPYEFWYRLFHRSNKGGFYRTDYSNFKNKEINFNWTSIR